MQGQLSPGGDGYDGLDSDGERWNPARVPGYVLKHQEDHGQQDHEQSELIKHSRSDYVLETVHNKGDQDHDRHDDFDADTTLELLLNHSFDR